MVGYEGNGNLVRQMVGAGDRNMTIPNAAIYALDGHRLWESDVRFVTRKGFLMEENGYKTPVKEIDRPDGEVCPYAFQVIDKQPMLSVNDIQKQTPPKRSLGKLIW